MYSRFAPPVLLALACLLPASATAQSWTIPPAYAGKPGPGLDQEPFGLDQIRQATYVDRSYLNGVTVGTRFRELRYRRDENRLDRIFSSLEPMRRNPTVLPVWEIKIGTFAGQYDDLDPNYTAAANRVTGLTTVFAGILNLTTNTPTLAPPPNNRTAAPFAIKFPLNIAQPLYAGQGIVVDHFAYERRNRQHAYVIDAVHQQRPAGGSVRLISPTSLGCPANKNRVHGVAPNPGAGNLDLYLFGAPDNTSSLAYFGASATSWGGTPLPLNLAFMGLPACNVYADLSIAVGVRTNSFGVGRLSVPIPGNNAFLGLTAYNQWGILDPRAGGGFAMSDGVRITLGNQLGQETIRMSVISGEGGIANNRVGFFQPNRGPVFQIGF